MTSSTARLNKFEILRQNIDVANGRGLEIGPLTSPVVTRDMGEIFYADHATTEELRAKYAPDPNVDEAKIMPVDFVWGARTLAEAVGTAAPFDYVVAMHVLEHVPDLVGWLREISAVLRPGGRLSVAMPDRRFTFDVRRRDTDISELVEAHLLRLRRPPVRAIFDHFYRIVNVDAGALWRGERGHDDPPFNARDAIDLARLSATTETYVDTHCWVFSDASFVRLIRELMQLDLIDLRFIAFTATRLGEHDFFATFERPVETLEREERIRRNVASVPVVHDTSPAVAAPSPGADVAALEDAVTNREARIRELEEALHQVNASTSWRLTAPLRKVRSALLRIRR